MARHFMTFRCEHGLIWKEYHSMNEPFDCPECGRRLYTPKSSAPDGEVERFDVCDCKNPKIENGICKRCGWPESPAANIYR